VKLAIGELDKLRAFTLLDGGEGTQDPRLLIKGKSPVR
jgi:hypothetical protein